VRDSSNAAYFCLSTEDPEDDVGMFSFMEPTRRGARNLSAAAREQVPRVKELKSVFIGRRESVQSSTPSRGMLSRAAFGRRCTTSGRRALSSTLGRIDSYTSTTLDGTSTEGQEKALVHFCGGLRKLLQAYSTEPTALASNRESIVRECSALRATLPVSYGKGGVFMSSSSFAQAFGYEAERAASSEHLAEIINLMARCAEFGLVPYHSVRQMYASVHSTLSSSGARHGAALKSLDAYTGRRVTNSETPSTSNDVSSWSVTSNNAHLDAKLVAAAMECKTRGYAVVDGLLGEPTSTSIRCALEAFASANKDTFTKGELDQSERKLLGDDVVDTYRDDFIYWLTGAEPGLVGAFAQFMRVTVLNPLTLVFGQEGNLAPVDSYVSNAMLSVYRPGASGFVPHVDNCGPDRDPRALTAIYYPSSSETSAFGGHLALFPQDASLTVRIAPTPDRLVLFASARVPHAVEGFAAEAKAHRMAVSFWYIGDPTQIIEK